MFPSKVVNENTLEFTVDSKEIELYNRYPVGFIFSIRWGGPWSYRKLVVKSHKAENNETIITCEDV